DSQDVVDLYAPRLDPLHEIADDRLGDIHRDGSAHQLPSEIEAIDGTLQLASTLGQPVGEQCHHTPRKLEGRIDGTLLLRPLGEDLEAQRGIHGANFRNQPPLQTRAHAIIEAVELYGRPRRGHHHLPAPVEQRVDDVLEFLFGSLPAHELEVIDQQDVDLPELVLEGRRILALDRLNELIAEA